jgi:PII-like signaling protein
MRFEGTGQLLRIFIGESDRFDGKPLFQALVERARAEGLAGATVVRGIEGYGATSHLHTSRILRLSEDLPVIVEIVDTAQNIERVMSAFDEMVGDGLMTLEAAKVITYRGSVKGDRASIVEDRLRILAKQAQEVASEGRRADATAALESSVHAARQYGATEAQIVQATGLAASEVRRIVAPRTPLDSAADNETAPPASTADPSRVGRFADGQAASPGSAEALRVGRFSDGQSSDQPDDRIGRYGDGQARDVPASTRPGRFSDGQERRSRES